MGCESQRVKPSRQPKQALNAAVNSHMIPRPGDSSHRVNSRSGNADMHFVSSFGRKSSKPRDNSSSLTLINRSANLVNHARKSSASQFYQQSHLSSATGATPSFPLGGPNLMQEAARSRSPNDPRCASPYGDGRIFQTSQSNVYSQLSPSVVMNPTSGLQHFQSHADSHLIHSFEAADLVNNSRFLQGLDRSFANSPIVSAENMPRQVYAVHDGSTGNVPIKQAVGSGIQGKGNTSGSPAQTSKSSRFIKPAQRKRIDASNENMMHSQRSAILSNRSDVLFGKNKNSVEADMEYQLKMASRFIN